MNGFNGFVLGFNAAALLPTFFHVWEHRRPERAHICQQQFELLKQNNDVFNTYIKMRLIFFLFVATANSVGVAYNGKRIYKKEKTCECGRYVYLFTTIFGLFALGAIFSMYNTYKMLKA